MTKLNQIEGFEAMLAQNLLAHHIETLEELLNAGKTVIERKTLAAKVRVTERTISRWVSVADLARVNGIHLKYARLLQVARVGSVQDLAQADASQLHTELEFANRRGHKYVSRIPATTRLKKWIEEAQSAEIVIETHAPMAMPQL